MTRKEGFSVEGCLVVLAGTGIGGLTPYVAGTWIMAKYGGRFPLGTLAINVTAGHS